MAPMMEPVDTLPRSGDGLDELDLGACLDGPVRGRTYPLREWDVD